MRTPRTTAFVLAALTLAFSPPLAQAQPEPHVEAQDTLAPGAAVEHVLPPGTTHTWSLSLEAGRYVEVDVEQRGADIVLQVFDPDGEQVQEVDGTTRNVGAETARWIAGQAGLWQVRVAPYDERATGGYAVVWKTDRPAGERERLLMEADSAFGAAQAHRDAYRYGEAEPLYRHALEIYEPLLGPDHPDVARALTYLARSYHALHRFEEAEPLFRRAAAIYEAALGPDALLLGPDALLLGPDALLLGQALSWLGVVYGDQGRYDEAEALFRRSLRIHEHVLGPDHIESAVPLEDLSWLYRDQGRYEEAGRLLLRTLRIHEQALGPDHPDVAWTLNNLALLYESQARYDDAENLYLRALRINEQALGPDHPDVANELNNLAVLYEGQGRYDEAEPLAKRSLAIREATFGPDHPDVAQGFNNLAVVYSTQGRFDEAEPLYRRALAIHESAFGPDHPEVAIDINNLARVYHGQGRYDEAEPLFKRSLAIREATYGPDHPRVARAFHNLALLYESQGRFDEAATLFKRSLAIREHVLGPDHVEVAQSLKNLARLYTNQGRTDEAGALVDRALAIFDATTARPGLRIEAYALRARLHDLQGDRADALADLEEALRSAEELRPQISGGEETRAGFFQRYADAFHRMTTWLIEDGDLDRAFEYAERGRARVLLDQLAAGKIDLRSSIPADVRAPLEARETRARARMAKFQQRLTHMRGRTDLSDQRRLAHVAALEDSLRAADRAYRAVYADIKNASPLWRDLITSGGQPVDLTTVQRRLVPRNGLMLLYQIGSEQSFVFALAPGGEPIQTLPLEVDEHAAAVLGVSAGALTSETLHQVLGGKGQEANGLVPALASRGVRAVGARGPVDRLHALWQVLIPESLRTRLLVAEEVVVVPDEALFHLPFETLVVEPSAGNREPRYWLDAGPVVRYAPSATVLYAITRRPAPRATPLADAAQVISLSDALYDPEDVALASETVPEAVPDSAPAVALALDRTRNNYTRVGGSLARLPGTARETEAIERAYGEAAGRAVTKLQRLDAGERLLREAIDEPRILHLATHGLVDERRGALFASLALTPPPGLTAAPDDDGFLQLHEIYDLKLPTVELAVLSACATNVGEVVEGEGVFALSRGFLAAGARRVVASQWAVDDASTAVLMGAFFEAVAAAERSVSGVDYARALRDAKRMVREDERWSDPYYWAPFVLTGME